LDLLQLVSAEKLVARVKRARVLAEAERSHETRGQDLPNRIGSYALSLGKLTLVFCLFKMFCLFKRGLRVRMTLPPPGSLQLRELFSDFE
jgi:hypothetical protein